MVNFEVSIESTEMPSPSDTEYGAHAVSGMNKVKFCTGLEMGTLIIHCIKNKIR